MRFRNHVFWLISLVLLTCLAACGGGGDGTSSTLSGRQGRLTVSLDTLSGSTGASQGNVSRSPMFVLRFSHPIDPSTVNTQSIALFKQTSEQSRNIPIALSNITADPSQTRYAFSAMNYLSEGAYILIVYDSVDGPAPPQKMDAPHSVDRCNSFISPYNQVTTRRVSPLSHPTFTANRFLPYPHYNYALAKRYRM